jgi:pimeloyl-ACP methyl ester carboxylesterase
MTTGPGSRENSKNGLEYRQCEGLMEKPNAFKKVLLRVSASVLAVFITVTCYLAYVYVPPEDRSYQSPYLKSITSNFLNTDEFRIHYTHAGEGDPLILIHGSCAWIYNFRNNIPALSKKFSVYALDMPGNGYTVPLCENPDYDLDMMSNALLNFMDEKQIRQASLIGHSSGGGWALCFASLHPERIKKLILIDSNGFDIPEKLAFRLFYIPIIGELFSKFFTYDDVKKGYEDSFYNKSLISDQMIREAITPLTFFHNRKAQYKSIRNQDWQQTELALPSMQIPTLVIWGKYDQYLDSSLAERFSRTMPNTRVEILDNCGHSSHEEQPDKVNELILEFL